MPVAVMALQKLEHIKGLLYRDNILSDISAMRPVDCVGLPPDISVIDCHMHSISAHYISVHQKFINKQQPC